MAGKVTDYFKKAMRNPILGLPQDVENVLLSEKTKVKLYGLPVKCSVEETNTAPWTHFSHSATWCLHHRAIGTLLFSRDREGSSYNRTTTLNVHPWQQFQSISLCQNGLVKVHNWIQLTIIVENWKWMLTKVICPVWLSLSYVVKRMSKGFRL